jgi:hypothetical protein
MEYSVLCVCSAWTRNTMEQVTEHYGICALKGTRTRCERTRGQSNYRRQWLPQRKPLPDEEICTLAQYSRLSRRHEASESTLCGYSAMA